MVRSIGFIGGGRVTRILLGGWNLAQALPELVELMRLAESFGLGAEAAEEATYQMVVGTAKALHGSGLPPEEVIDLIPVAISSTAGIRPLWPSPVYRVSPAQGWQTICPPFTRAFRSTTISPHRLHTTDSNV